MSGTNTHEELLAEAIELIKSCNDEKSLHALQIALEAALKAK